MIPLRLATIPLLALSLCACSVMQETFRDLSNDNLVDLAAPPLDSGEWILPWEGDAVPNFHEGWTLLAFFKPT